MNADQLNTKKQKGDLYGGKHFLGLNPGPEPVLSDRPAWIHWYRLGTPCSLLEAFEAWKIKTGGAA